jgi:hypothetical protein
VSGLGALSTTPVQDAQRCKTGKSHGGAYLVMAGLVPAISIIKAPFPGDRDRRDKPGDDELGATSFAPSYPALDRGVVHMFCNGRSAAIYARIFSPSHPGDALLGNVDSFAVLVASLISLQLISLICAAIRV